VLSTKLDFDQDFIPGMARDIVGDMLSDASRFQLLHRSRDAAVYKVAGKNDGSANK
jgi:hypothetical protein